MFHWRASRVLVGSSIISFISGCAASYGAAHERRAGAGTSEDLRHFDAESADFRRAGTPAQLGAPLLDRPAYLRAVLEQNPTLEAARQGYRAALARAEGAGAFDDPMLDVGVAPLSVGSSKAPFGYELGISQRLPWFGKRSLETAAATAEAAATKGDLEALKRDLALSALLLYDEYFVAERSLEINVHHVELMRALRDAATAQFQSGRGSAQDSLQAEGELAHMEHDRALLTSQRDVTVAQMNELLHRAAELPLPPPARELPLPDIPKTADFERLQASALANRSEIGAAQQRAQAGLSRAARADRDSYPDLTVSTSYNSMWDTPEHRWMVGLGLNLPIQSGKRAAAADEAQAMSAEFASEATRLRDSARTQVFVALKRLQEAEHVVLLFEQRLLPLANERIEAARAGFSNAQNPFTAALEAEKNLRSTELDYQMARADCDRQRAELDRALGRTPGLDAAAEKP